MNIGFHNVAEENTEDRSGWHRIVEMAMLQCRPAHDDNDDNNDDRVMAILGFMVTIIIKGKN